MAGEGVYMSGPWIFSKISKWLCLLLNYFWEIKTEGSEMRYLYFACISSYLVLFFCNHAHARIGETYEKSVERYEDAGFTKKQTFKRVPGNDKGEEWTSVPKYIYKKITPTDNRKRGVTELTWTNTDTEAPTNIGIVSINQIFFGEWPATNFPPPYETFFYCIDITYKLKDEFCDPNSDEFIVMTGEILRRVLPTPETIRWYDTGLKEDEFRRYLRRGKEFYPVVLDIKENTLNISMLHEFTSQEILPRPRSEYWKQLKMWLDKKPPPEELKAIIKRNDYKKKFKDSGL